MFHAFLHTPFLIAAAGPTDSLYLAVVFVAGATIAMLVWLHFRNRRQYLEDLSDQARLLSEQEERVQRALATTEALTRESQAKSEMLATLSREIRQHLNGIIGSADLLLDLSPSPQQREHLSTLRSAAESLHLSLNDVLEFADLESGHVAISKSVFDLRQPLIDAIEQILPIATLKGLEVVLVVSVDVPVKVVGDPARLRQIMFNLLTNAVKFTSAGRVVLNVDLPEGSGSVSPNGATWLHFSVSDTGVGIPEEMRDSLFDQIEKGDAQSPRQFAGAGLGLAICNRLVSLMGGKIGVRDSREGGAEFWVVLPIPADRDQPKNVTLAGRYAIVLDELAASRVATSALLSRAGIEHDVTDSATKAISLLHEAADEKQEELILLLDESAAKTHRDELSRALALDNGLDSVRVVLLIRDSNPTSPKDFGIPLAGIVRKPLLRPESLLEVLAGGDQVPEYGTTFIGVAKAPAVTRPPHVLVVDDDEISRTVTYRLLTRLGCQVEMATGGPAAITMTRGTRFDLIFMDCQMPGMDGFATTEVIRGAGGNSVPPIVALTANNTSDDKKKCTAAGMSDFIGKPVTRPELSRVLKRWAS